MRQIVIIIGLIICSGLLAEPVLAEEAAYPACAHQSVIEQVSGKMQLNVPLPGITEAVRCLSDDGSVKTFYILQAEPGSELSAYIRGFYVYFVWIVGILATVMIMFAGFQWITAAGNASRIENAKSTMNGALIGLVLILTSYLLLSIINPELVRLRVPRVLPVEAQFAGGFCSDELQALADAQGVGCGQVFEGKDKETGRTSFCMSTGCNTPEVCLACSGEKKPFEMCKQKGLQCAIYDNRVIVRGTITNLIDDPHVDSIALYRKNIKSFERTEELVWLKVKSIKGGDITEGGTIEFDTVEAVTLNQFKIDINFVSGWDARYCTAVEPSGAQDDYYFDVPYVQGGPSVFTRTFDIQAIYNQCIS